MRSYLDVTERKQAEEPLRQAPSRIESVLNNVVDIHILLDRDWRYRYVNDAAARAIGRPLEQILGHTLWELYPDIVGTELDRQYRRAMDERILVAFDYHYLSLDTWWENRFYPAPKGLFVFASDITQRKRVEQRLREYERAVEGLEEMVVVIDRDYCYLLANRAFLTYRGLERKQLLGVRIPELLNTGVFENVMKEKIDQCFAGKVIKYGLKHIYPGREERDLSISFFPIEGPTGIDSVACVLKDITDSKRAEEQLKATSEQLRALSASLQSAREEEATKIAREIHDELGAALSSLRWDLEDVDEAISENQSLPQELRKKIEAMVTLTDTTINTVRRISSEMRPIALDVLGLIEAIEWQARQFQDRTGIIVQFDCTLENIDLSLEQSTAVFRIFQEGLTNILRHAEATRVNIQMGQEDREFILTINDNGRGITDDEKSGQRTLGLLGMRERATLIGGKIDITGFEGQGTIVTLRIPISG